MLSYEPLRLLPPSPFHRSLGNQSTARLMISAARLKWPVSEKSSLPWCSSPSLALSPRDLIKLMIHENQSSLSADSISSAKLSAFVVRFLSFLSLTLQAFHSSRLDGFIHNTQAQWKIFFYCFWSGLSPGTSSSLSSFALSPRKERLLMSIKLISRNASRGGSAITIMTDLVPRSLYLQTKKKVSSLLSARLIISRWSWKCVSF